MRTIGRLAVRFRYLIIVLWLVATALCVHGFPSLASVTNSDNSTFLPSTMPSAQAKVLDQPFQPSGVYTSTIAAANPTTIVIGFPHAVWDDLNVVSQAEDGLAKHSVFRSVSGPLDPNGTPIQPCQLSALYAQLGPASKLPAVEPATVASSLSVQNYNAYRATAQYVSADGRTLQFYTTLAAGDPSSTAALHAIPQIRDAVQRVAHPAGAAANGVLGQAAAGYDVSNTSDSDLLHIVPIVMLLIAILLGEVLRSLVAPLYLVLTVGLSYFTALGLAVLIFIHLGGKAGLDFVLPFLMFIFLIALGEDYNILVMSRIREEAQQRPLPDAVSHALGVTGTTVTSAGLILAATFSVAAITGSTDQVRELGTGIAIGVLLDTFLVRTLLVPSIVLLLGRWNWWPASLARRAEAPRLEVAPAAS